MFLLCALTQPRQLQDQICCVKCSDLIAGELGKFCADLSAVQIEFCKLTTSGQFGILQALQLLSTLAQNFQISLWLVLARLFLSATHPD